MGEQAGTMLALEVVIRMLVSREKERDPWFANEAQAVFDEFLGRLTSEPREEILVDARKRLMSIVSTTSDLFANSPLRQERPLTWRRRFLLWLMK